MWKSVRARGNHALGGWVMRAALVTVCVLGTAAFGVFLLCHTPAGLGLLAQACSRGLSDRVAGSIRIGGLERVSFGAVEATNLRFVSPDGEPVLRLDRARLRLDWGRLWQGNLHVDQAETHGGQLRITETSSGEITLEQAFASPGPPRLSQPDGRSEQVDRGSSTEQASLQQPATGHGQSSSEDGPGLSIHDIRVHDLRVVIDLADLDPFVVLVAGALVRIDVQHGPEVRFEHVRGRVARHPFGDESIELLDLDGRYRGQVQELLQLLGDLNVAGDPAHLRLSYFDREDDPLVVRLSGLTARLLKWRGLAVLANFANADVEVSGSED